MLAKIKLRKGDTVIVNTGAEKGKKGTILDIDRKTGKVTVKGVNVRTKHVKARAQGQESGRIEVERAIHASKIDDVYDKDGEGIRLETKVNEDGTKSRFCKKCNEIK